MNSHIARALVFWGSYVTKKKKKKNKNKQNPQTKNKQQHQLHKNPKRNEKY